MTEPLSQAERERLRELAEAAQPSVDRRMVDLNGEDDGPHFTDEALIARHTLMTEAADIVLRLLATLDAAEKERDELRAENAEYDECANLMLDALLLIDEGPADPAMKADAAWSHGVAVQAIELLRERAASYRQQSHVPRFLPTWLGGQADRISGPGFRLGAGGEEG